MVVLAGVFGLAAVFVAQMWLSRQDALRSKAMKVDTKPAASRKVVVAKSPLRFGNPLQASMLSEVDWPENAVPAGAFASVNEMLAKGKRIVLAPIEPNEPVLAAKITGPGERATLSAVIHPGMKAVTVRVNDVEGVAGFILPGDRVDVMLTRRSSGGGDSGTGNKEGTTDVVVQNVPVLAIDQLADQRSDKPTVAKAVTLEVDTVDAQKLTLSAQLGVLSLALRKAGEGGAAESRRISASDIGRNNAPVEGKKNFSTITVTRALERKDYSVPNEDSDRWGDANAAGTVTR
jgi:pilus assembly protein CpaB